MKKRFLILLVLQSFLCFQVSAAQERTYSESAVSAAKMVQGRHEDYLFNHRGVQGVGISEKDGQLGVVVLLDEKADESEIPDRVDGLPVIMRKVGKIVAHQIDLGVSGGNSIICDNWCSCGTLGFKVCDNTASGVGGLITNNHVAAAGCPGLCPNNTPIGTGIYSPGIADNSPTCSTSGALLVGVLNRFEPLFLDGITQNLVDAAFVQSSEDLISDTIHGLGPQSKSISPPSFGQVVCKSGRTSGVTCGKVTAVNVTVNVSYGDNGSCGSGRFINQLEYSPTPPYTTMSQAGDSGSPVVDSSGKAVALNFAGEDRTGRGYGTPIRVVLEKLNVSLREATTSQSYLLNMSIDHPDGGSVTGSGANCPGTCSLTLPPCIQSTLMASAHAGYVFKSWSGCDSTSGTTCSLIMNSDKSVTASFSLQPHSLNINILPSAGGTVTGSGIKCSGTCASSYSSGTFLALTPAANRGYIFDHWDGCDSTSDSICYMEMTADKSVTATFIPVLADLTGQWVSMTSVCNDTRKGTRCTIKVKFRVQNIGIKDAPSSLLKFHLSSNSTPDGTVFFKKFATGKIKAGRSTTKSFSYSFPYGVRISGEYVLALIDADNAVNESDKDNNIVAYGPLPND